MLNRRHACLLLAGIGVAPAALAHPHGELDAERLADIERQIMAFRGALKDAIAQKQAGRLKHMYADAFTHTHVTGKVDDRATRIQSLLSGEAVIETASVSELSIRIFGSDMAILSGRSPVVSSSEKRTTEVRWSQVYTRASGHWQIASSQATSIAVTS